MLIEANPFYVRLVRLSQTQSSSGVYALDGRLAMVFSFVCVCLASTISASALSFPIALSLLCGSCDCDVLVNCCSCCWPALMMRKSKSNQRKVALQQVQDRCRCIPRALRLIRFWYINIRRFAIRFHWHWMRSHATA